MCLLVSTSLWQVSVNVNHTGHLINLKHPKGGITLEVDIDEGVTQLVAAKCD